MCKYVIKEKEIVFSNGNKVSFNYNIDKASLEVDGILIITLSVPSTGDELLNQQNDLYKRNVFGIDISNGIILWQLENHPSIIGNFNNPRRSLEMSEDIILYGWPNIEINIYNGKIMSIISKSQWD